jgi:hypothetical protein
MWIGKMRLLFGAASSAAILSVLTLTAPDGRPITFDLTTGMVIVPVSNEAHCAHGSHAVVTLGAKTICVRETPEQIRNKIDENSHQ